MGGLFGAVGGLAEVLRGVHDSDAGGDAGAGRTPGIPSA
jgi:hypothetical protein